MPAGTAAIGIEYYVAPQTTGIFDLDDVKVEFEI